MPDEITRRGFMRRAAGGAAVLLFGDDIAAVVGGGLGSRSDQESYDIHAHDYLLVIDVSRCMGCGDCVRACEHENGVAPGFFRTWVERYRISGAGEVRVDSPDGGRDGFEAPEDDLDAARSFFVPKICNHCSNAPCVRACPLGATYRTPDGAVLLDGKRCIGCGYCVRACPYGARYMHPAKRTASKCTLCYHRVTRGMLPICVRICSTGARLFGDRKRKNDPAYEIVSSREVRVLRPELRARPNCFYLGMSDEVR